jgi:L-2-hydroxyglutarate oxidase
MTTLPPRADVAIVGGGIVGLATAYQITERQPGARVVVLEKEDRVAAHQTGRNSGVLHSGIYYKPGTLRASNCRAGKLAMEAFCEREGVAYERCGKVIVATREDERPVLTELLARGEANGVECERIGPERLREIEPHAAGIDAIHVPESGIVDYTAVCIRLAEIVAERGGAVVTGAAVTNVVRGADGVAVETTQGDVQADLVVNCAGLHSDRVAKMTGHEPEHQIVPFRGEYFELKPHAHRLCRGLIYPAPDPRMPWLGVHFTKMVHGGVECGPNAVFAFAREGYRERDVDLRDLREALAYVGFRRLSLRYWKIGAFEMARSFSKRLFVSTLQRLIPEVTLADLEASPAGVRALALSPDGELVDDFVIEADARVVNVCNAPSPAATAALNVGDLVAAQVQDRVAAL